VSLHPTLWQERKISQSFCQIGSGTTPKSGLDVYYEGGTINWINTGDLNDGVLRGCKRKVTARALKDYSLKIYPFGSIIIAMYGATIGKVSISEINGCTNQACCVLSDSKTININFLFYWFLSQRDYIISLAYGGGQPNISQDTIKNLRVTSPLLVEQQAIANYLDTKTEQIDRKIELLSQKAEKYGKLKQSLINETVTRGLDKSVPMKDSGIEWIGDVPAHWEVKHLKSLAKIKGGKDSKAVEIEVEGYPIYGSGGVFGRASEYLHKKTSVLLGRKGTIDKPLFVTEPFWSVDTMFYTDIKKNVDPKFFYYQCLTIKFGLYQYGSAVPSMSENVLSRILFATPEYDEQQRISSYLDEKTVQIDQIIESINNQVNNLKELRKTLINDVVTGKIKVV